MNELLIEYGLPVLGSLISIALGYLVKYLRAKAGNEILGRMMIKLTSEIDTLVKSTNQTLKKEIKKAKNPKSKGGKKLTKEEAQEIKEKVLEEFKNLWGVKGIAKLAKILGFSEDKIYDFLDNKIEEAVFNNKNP